jgi:hypothetical protein
MMLSLRQEAHPDGQDPESKADKGQSDEGRLGSGRINYNGF